MWPLVITAYLSVGLAIILATPARSVIIDSLKHTNMRNATGWEVFSFRFIACVIAITFWPIFLPGWLRENKSAWEELNGNPIFNQQKGIYDAMNMLCEDGCETDEIPGSYGEYGHEVTNPIPTKTVIGSTTYLAKLRSLDGAKVVNNRQGSVSSPVSSHPIDRYSISHPDGRHHCRVNPCKG